MFQWCPKQALPLSGTRLASCKLGSGSSKTLREAGKKEGALQPGLLVFCEALWW